MPKNRLLLPVLIVLGVTVVIIVLIPLLVNVDRFRPTIQAQLQSSLGRLPDPLQQSTGQKGAGSMLQGILRGKKK